MPAGDRYVLLQQLAQLHDADRGLLANARCLAEGVDVPALDGVAFIDPRRSEVDIIQAVGRAIRKSLDKALGTVVIPVFIDTSTDPEVALKSSAFKPVWDVIKALRAHDIELGEYLDALRRELGREQGRPRLPPKIHTDIPSRVGTDFARAFEVLLVEKTTSSWEFWFGLIEQYVLDNGDAQVHIDYTVDGHRLGRWCSSQRVKYIRGELAPHQAARLADLPGWSWQRNDDRWEKGFALLLAYIDSNGHTLIGAREQFQGFPLGSWAANQRRAYRRDELEHDRRQRLDDVPAWVWSLEDERWERGFDYLLQYVALNKHSRVPQTFKNDHGFQLGAWVNFQRTRFNRGSLEIERARRLAALPGWVWRASEAKWEEGFERLREYADEHGHVRVPRDYKPDGFKLRIWATNQRAKVNKLSRDRQRRLQDLPGWNEYGQDAKWEAGFERLVGFVQEHGDAKVLRYYEVGGYPLGSWVMTQRQEFRRGTLAPERQERLAQLPGWDWDRRTGKWDEGLGHLVEYVRNNGLANPASSYIAPDGYRLGAWTQQQRYLHNTTGQLLTERKNQLEKLPGWEWSPPRGASVRH